MPFRSAKQRRFLFAKHPEIAEDWAKKYGIEVKPNAKPDRRKDSKRNRGNRKAVGRDR